MNCIIIDDDEFSRNAINQCIERTETLELTASCTNVTEALKVLKGDKVDLIFLDMEMPEMSGMDFIRNFNVTQQIIIVSSYKDYAAEAYDFNVTDYIVKPVNYARFLKAVNKVKDVEDNLQVDPKHTTDLFIKKRNKLVRVQVSDIVWVEALADYVNIYTDNARFTILSTMKAIEHKLPTKEFARIHRSYIVRLDKIKEIEDNTVIIGDKRLAISRTYQDNLNKRLNFL